MTCPRWVRDLLTNIGKPQYQAWIGHAVHGLGVDRWKYPEQWGLITKGLVEALDLVTKDSFVEAFVAFRKATTIYERWERVADPKPAYTCRQFERFFSELALAWSRATTP